MSPARHSSTYRAARRAAAKAAGVPYATRVAAGSAFDIRDAQLARRAIPIDHVGANPLHCVDGRDRHTGQLAEALGLRGPRNPNKYVPHIGAKQLAKAAARTRKLEAE